ncbi:MAG TPA: DNA-processing protein DprA [Myxococcales bacterium]|nr:DNA-processing protein DprA [Myxococcales bacterium]
MNETSQIDADGAGCARPDVVAACALGAVPGVGASTLARIAARYETLSQAMEEGPTALLRDGEALKLNLEARDYLAQGPDLHELGAYALEAARRCGARVLLLGDEGYPKRLCGVPNPPRLLYVRGSLAAEARRVAVVGSRDADEAGLDLAHRFGDAFARAGVEVVSGGARGIDTAAHEGALWGEGRSVAVLGSGIDVDYPPDNRNLFERLANGGGAVVSELPPGTEPAARNFPRRNRIVAGLSDAVVVVRAALRSGALITAAQAGARGTKVYAVPGDPSNWRAEGSNALLRDGQALVTTGPIDVLTDLDWPIPEILLSTAATRTGVPESYPGEPIQPDRTVVDAVGVKLWQLLDGRTPAHVDDLALRAQIPAREALGKLAELELKGMVVQRPGKYFLRR